MKKLLLVCLIYFQIPSVHSQAKYFQQQVNYKIDVSLNDASNTLTGFEIINYTNNSPDTLNYIWFHLWPNAYKNDRTAFSEQLLQLGRTDFYFSDENKRGYINRLDFKVNGTTANLEDHPRYIDVAKLILPNPLLPGQTIKISTPFHEKLPFNFSRGGYVGQTYQITQWYPKPAVYDNKGWHPIPYLDQGEFFSEFGNFDVTITIPKNYVVAATGVLQNKEEIQWLKERASSSGKPNQKKEPVSKTKNVPPKVKTPIAKNQKLNNKKPANPEQISNLSSTENKEPSGVKELHYIQNNIHDFAWFADKDFIVRHDTLKLTSGKIIDAYAFFTPSGLPVWKNSIQFLKDAIRTRSKWLGEYPYPVVTAVEAKMGFSGGMEYPTITSISPMPDEQSLDMVIEHEVGHNWNYGILATDERDHPWMDEGINTYFDNRYKKLKYPNKHPEEKKDFFDKRIPTDAEDLVYRIQIADKKDQPIETSSEDFSDINYGLIAYYKTGLWMKKLEDFIGKDLFDSCLHEYYNRWKFKHPQPDDFKKVVTDISQKNVDSIFLLLSKKGSLEPARRKEFKIASFFNFKETDKYNYLFISPTVGYNYYDKLMIGGLIHNYTLPEPAFHFVIAPMYGKESKTFTGIGKVGYNFMSYGLIRKAEISVSGEKFSINEFTDPSGKKNYFGFSKIAPSVKLVFRNKNATSTVTKWVQWKTYFIRETGVLFTRDTINQVDVISYPKTNRDLNQFTLGIENNRVLYPYSVKLTTEQGEDFIRLAFEGKYFFNYAKGGGLNVRIFLAKFGYIGNKNTFNTYIYQPKLLGGTGIDDYTYDSYFLGRTAATSNPNGEANQGLGAQQIMIENGGGLKFRLDKYGFLQGQSDNWIAAANLCTSLPNRLFDNSVPLKIFFDIGTYADVWKKEAIEGYHFLYTGGLQLSMFKDVLNIYLPIIYSKEFHNTLKTDPQQNKFFKKIFFSINLESSVIKKFLPF